jgi:hypothetical protein
MQINLQFFHVTNVRFVIPPPMGGESKKQNRPLSSMGTFDKQLKKGKMEGWWRRTLEICSHQRRRPDSRKTPS